MRFLSLILKNTLRNRRRTLLTIASVALSFCLLGILLALYNALYFSEAKDEQALRLVTRHKVSLTLVMPRYYDQQIQQLEGLEAVVPTMWYGGSYRDSRDQRNFFPRFACDPARLFQVYPDFVIDPAQKHAFIQDRRGALVGRTLADRFGWEIGERITLVGDIFPGELELYLRGIYEHPVDDEMLYFPIEYLYEGLPSGRRDFVGTYVLLAKTPEDVPRVATALDDMFRNSPVPTRTETEKAFALSFLSFLGNVKVFLLGLCGAVTFTILLVSSNTMAMSIRERYREVGVLKTLGFTQGGVIGILLGEASAIALAGGALGLVLASVLCIGVRSLPAFVQETKTLSIEPQVALFCLVFAALMGAGSALVPALGAARASVVDALRFTD